MSLLTKKEIDHAKVDDPDKKWRVLFDGDGLYLRVSRPPEQRRGRTNKYFFSRLTYKGKRIDVGIGPYPIVTLAQARDENLENRRNARTGIDPRKAKNTEIPTFAEAVEQYLEKTSGEFKNEKHIAQWRMTLTKYAAEAGLGPLKVDDIETENVLNVLKPIWTTKTETATRVRGRIEKVLAWARTKGFRSGDNPALWKSNLEHLLPNPTKLKQTKNRPALPWQDLPDFWKALKSFDAVSSECLRFLILTGVRSGEARAARWDEIDGDVWTIPADRMKMGVAHRVPLSTKAKAVLHRVQGLHDEFIFPTPGKSKVPHLSDNAVSSFLKKSMDRSDVTPHGFRTTLRTWLQDEEKAEWEVAEMCLAHKVGDSAAQAYARSDLLERRREVMSNWAEYAVSKL